MYQNDIKCKEALLLQLSKTCNQISALRLLLFLGGGVGLYFMIGNPLWMLITYLVAWIISFLYCVKWHDSKHQKLQFNKNYLQVCLQEQESLSGHFSSFPEGSSYINHEHAYSHDLDLFGPHSFFQSLNRSHAPLGESLLASLLTQQELNVDCIRQRQEAVQELKDKYDFRMHFRTLAHTFPSESPALYWEIPVKVKNYWTLLSRLFTAINVLMLGLCMGGILPWTSFSIFPLIGFGVLIFFSAKVTQRMNLRGKSATYLSQCIQLMKLIKQEDFQSELLKQQKEQLSQENGAPFQINRLLKILNEFEYRNNLYVGLFLNMLFLWDLRCMGKLIRWEKDNGRVISQWLEALKGFDCYNSLGFFAYNHPHCNYPVLENKDQRALYFEQLKHPLMDAQSCVGNDYSMNSQSERLAIVTGANMAGKSTFLRSVGLNIVMASAGLPVCAQKMIYSPVPLFSSMRTTDSITKGTSYFFAELQRLQFIIQQTQEQEGSVFVLLDEILKGTNSKDKAAGSRLILKKFLSLHAQVLIATHDLDLCDLQAQFPKEVINLCFEISHQEDQMIFDYKIKPGITQNMNALYLISKMGLD